jgi:Sulfatase-modifying factor enzyme 1
MATPFTLSLDRTGFPILEMPDLRFGMLWLPVTKIQFEHFLVDTGAFDNAWYQDKLDHYNPRISAGNIGVTNYWQAFMTGILPIEASSYAAWVGQGADLPTAQEWKQALITLARWPADRAFHEAVLQLPGLNERARLLIQKMESVLQAERSQLSDGYFLCDQMAMRLGVLELMYEDTVHGSFGCWGQPNRRFVGGISNPLRDTTPRHFTDRNGVRMGTVGFRLIMRRLS